MAPYIEDNVPVNVVAADDVTTSVQDLKLKSSETTPTTNGPSYPYYYPYFDVDEKFPPTELFKHSDPGLRADPAKPHLLAKATTRVLNPYIGTEVRGVQVSQLSREGLDELALLAAERKLVVFRDQDFKDLTPERQIVIAQHFGPIQRHPTSGNVKGFPEFHVVYRDGQHDRRLPRTQNGLESLTQVGWHSDVSYEKQPPGTTLFWILDQPKIGGDTQFASQVEAYNRFSPAFKKRLEGLAAIHSAVPQANYSRDRGGPVRREPVETEHPLVRVHPVTGEKALYVNKGFTKYIVGYKQEESDNLLNFLFDHIAKGTDFHIRANYEPGTLVIWDNRLTVHSATPDFDATQERRHAVRLTPQAEVPVAARVE